MKQNRHNFPGIGKAIVCGLIGYAMVGGTVHAQPNLCGCAGNPASLGDFDGLDQSTWPPGTTRDNSGAIVIPLPEDGVLIFDNFTVSGFDNQFGYPRVTFSYNEANSPVTLLVKGDVVVGVSNSINVDGKAGTPGNNGVNGEGGLGGPGGFRGGDGAYQLVNLVREGGPGLGPGGGASGTAEPLLAGGDGTYVGSNSLLPLVGGAGGGGGASSDSAQGCSGGGGGGGGGAILIAANGTITIDGIISARGGYAGGAASFQCSSNGGFGSGGAIRLIASSITGQGGLDAGNDDGTGIDMGMVRLEGLNITLSGSNTTPVAIRSFTPGPITLPLVQTVAIGAVNDEILSLANNRPLTELPQGVFGVTDVVVQNGGMIDISLETSGIPAGTGVEVTAKPRAGGNAIQEMATLHSANCNTAGQCSGFVTLTLSPGTYTLEARATFQP